MERIFELAGDGSIPVATLVGEPGLALAVESVSESLVSRYGHAVVRDMTTVLSPSRLDELAARLNARETAPGTWCADAVTEVAPRLHLDGIEASGIPEAEFFACLCDYLREAPVAWDPYDWEG